MELDTYDHRSKRLWLARARRKKEEQEAEKKRQALLDLCDDISENRKQCDVEKNKKEKRRKICCKFSRFAATTAACASFLIASSYIFIVIKANTNIIPLSSPTKNLASNSRDFIDVQCYIGNLLIERWDSHDFKLLRVWSDKAPPEQKELGNQILPMLTRLPFKVVSVQLNRASGQYWVYCDFKDRGNAYFTLTKRNSDFLIVSVESDTFGS